MESEFFLILRLKVTSWACLLVSRLKFIFQWVADLFILPKSMLRLSAKVWMSYITENKEDSSEKLVLH